MVKCPYCSIELHIEDFFVTLKIETKKGKINTKVVQIKGESIEIRHGSCRMWVYPSCHTILGFSEYAIAAAH